jgi:dipeptidyl aminopeptidase/acylaminoacyl peptidase
MARARHTLGPFFRARVLTAGKATQLLLCLFAVISVVAPPANAQNGVDVSDCIQMRWVVDGEVSISSDQRKIAYLTRQADVASNQNIYRLFVRDLGQLTHVEDGRELFRSRELSMLNWIGNGEAISVLKHENGRSEIDFINIRSGKVKTVVTRSGEISDYAVDAEGKTIVFSVVVPTENEGRQEISTSTVGVFVPFGVPYRSRLRDAVTPGSKLYLVKLGRGIGHEVTELKLPHDPGEAEQIPRGLSHLTVSPDGRYLTYARIVADLPDAWKTDPLILWRSFGGPIRVLYLYDLNKGTARIAFNAADAGLPVWSSDSHAFALFATSPVASSWEKDDLRGFGEGGLLKSGPMQSLRDPKVRSLFHVFGVDAQTTEASLVLGRLDYETANVSFSWTEGSSSIECLTDSQTVVRLARRGSEWLEVERTQNASFGAGEFANGSLRLGRKFAVGVNHAVGIPPDLYLYELDDRPPVRLTRLNDEFDNLRNLGEVETVDWSNKYGATTSGYLIKPVGFRTGTKYPLVIMAKTWNDRFVCDGFGSGETTAFPPQPLASAGFMVLLANDPSLDHEPQGYPGRMGEVYNWIEMVKSAVEVLAKRGLIDSKQVGVIGFSRTSWKVDFMLTHSDFRFVAASSADGGLYNYGAYWTHNIKSLQDSLESQLGGPPYGDSFDAWLRFAPAFNAEKANCPLLMEYTSSDGVFDEPVDAYELYTALNRNGKSVELYFYPSGKHQLDTPLERLSSLQRNVDWFRFWMQGYERPKPSDPGQYDRWRNLRNVEKSNRSRDSVK